MDANGFRKAQEPYFFSDPSNIQIENQAKAIEVASKTSLPSSDNRYPGFAAQMNDGRIITDYRPNCSLNMPTGTQFATRRWLQTNAETIISLSRERQAAASGAGKSYDASIELDPIGYVICDEAMCGYTPSGNPFGIGIERMDKAAPLFGTFTRSYPVSKHDEPQLTSFYEGGRNSIRGQF